MKKEKNKMNLYGNDIEKQLSYQDVFLEPKKCIVDSRTCCETVVVLGSKLFQMPVYPSNMKSVVDIETCKFLAKNGWFYTMHRFGIDYKEFMIQMRKENLFTSISVGIKKESRDILIELAKNGLNPDYITIDVANAWSDRTKSMMKFIKDIHGSSFLIVGNIATSEAAKEVEEWGADALKVGISGGSVCITKNKTGVYRGMVNTVQSCCDTPHIPIIADGGIVEHGDIAKAIACGATMVMAGSLFAGYDQSAGNVIEIEDRMYKEYYGSASKYNKEEYKNIEGKKILIPYKGDMSKLLIELKQDLQSSISYVGGKNLEDLRKAEF
jgi:GMP reductase